MAVPARAQAFRRGVPARAAQAQRPCASGSASHCATRGAGGSCACGRACASCSGVLIKVAAAPRRMQSSSRHGASSEDGRSRGAGGSRTSPPAAVLLPPDRVPAASGAACAPAVGVRQARPSFRSLRDNTKRAEHLLVALKQRIARGACARCAACEYECPLKAGEAEQLLQSTEKELLRLQSVRERARVRRATANPTATVAGRANPRYSKDI